MTDQPLPIGSYANPVKLGIGAIGVLLVFAPAISTLFLIKGLVSGASHEAAIGGVGAVSFGAGFARLLYDFRPQRAWLDGTDLIVKRTRKVRCDLTSASVIKLRRIQGTTRGVQLVQPGWAPVLYARQDAHSRPTRLLLRGPNLFPVVSPGHLRMLAHAIGQRPEPHDDQTRRVIQGLYALADDLEKPPLAGRYATDEFERYLQD